MARGSRTPPERTETARERIREALADGQSVTLRELSVLVGISERDLPQHLEHLARSLKAEGHQLVIEPAECLSCGFVFEDRQRFTRPSRCPKCRQSRIAPPRVYVQ